jgi:nucleoside-diphosphate-sugar epimerase
MKMKQGTIVGITGASGYVGSAIVNAMAERDDCRVICVARRAISSDKPNVHVHQVREFEPDALLEALYPCHIVVHAASPVIFDARDGYADVIKPALECTHSVLSILPTLPNLRRFVHISSTVTCVDTSSSKFTFSEQDVNQSREKDPYTTSKLATEDLVALACKGKAWDTVVLAPGVVLGNFTGKCPESFRYVRDVLRTRRWCVKRDGHFSVCDVDDLASAVERIALHPDHVTGKYVVAAGVVTLSDVARIAKRKMWFLPSRFPFAIDNAKSRELLGPDFYRPVLETLFKSVECTQILPMQNLT